MSYSFLGVVGFFPEFEPFMSFHRDVRRRMKVCSGEFGVICAGKSWKQAVKARISSDFDNPRRQT
jgi:hypothetical protein